MYVVLDKVTLIHRYMYINGVNILVVTFGKSTFWRSSTVTYKPRFDFFKSLKSRILLHNTYIHVQGAYSTKDSMYQLHMYICTCLLKGIFLSFLHKFRWKNSCDLGSMLWSQFSAIYGNFLQKIAFFSKTNVMIKILDNLALFWVKNANCFAEFFGENI
jgi:hypothetical protein